MGTDPGAVDADQDGFNAPRDCDDDDPTIYPGAPDEPYDGVDADCAGDSDFDADGDRYDAVAYGGDDCDDMNARVFPGRIEECDGADNDCDGTVDSPVPDGAPTWYPDLDGDLYGDPAGATVACSAPTGHVEEGTDCDDDDKTTYPGASAVVCDGIDNDCDDKTFEPAQPARIGAVDHATLQAAVDLANDGDVIELCEGLHEVDGLVILDRIEIRGVGDPAATRIQPASSDTVITVGTTQAVTLTRVMLTGGTGTQVGDDLRGGGLLLAAGADVTLDEVLIQDNGAEYGAGVFAGAGTTLTLTGTEVRDNAARLGMFGTGGGLFLEESVSLTMSDTIIADNEAEFSAGGIEAGADSVVDGSMSSVVTGNLADLNGGGLVANFGVTITGLDFVGNEAVSAGALYGTDLQVTDSVIEGNYGSVSTGGALMLGVNRFERVTVDGNVGDIDTGGVQVDGGLLEMVDCTVVRNGIASTLGDAGGVELFGAELASTNTDWGTGTDLNLPSGVWLSQSEIAYNPSGVSTFTCDDDTGTCK